MLHLGEFCQYSPHLIYVLSIPPSISEGSLIYSRTFPIDPLRSMIPKHLQLKTTSRTFPLTSSDMRSMIPVLQSYIHLNQILKSYSDTPCTFCPHNYFEFVIKCRMEYRLRFHCF